MKPSQTIFNKDFDTVTIPTHEYMKLKLYEEFYNFYKEKTSGVDAE